MVWGLAKPSGLGDYSPLGNFEGWREQLRAYFKQQPPEWQTLFKLYPQAYVTFVAYKFIYEQGQKLGEKPPLTPIEPHEVPKVYRTEKRYTSLGSLLTLTNGFLAVDATLKEIIEGVEPGVHQFWPLKIVMTKDQPYPVPYYIMVIGRFLESFSADQSDPKSFIRLGEGICTISVDTKDYYSGVALKRSVFTGAHLWRERKLGRHVCMSDQLQTEIKRAGLRIWKHWPMREV